MKNETPIAARGDEKYRNRCRARCPRGPEAGFAERQARPGFVGRHYAAGTQ